ncbi:MAG: T9SS type A sorting domain-containing protein, partial [Mariniphaga sp.]|nr:T9SS type A sorting domain-containing protein [Mariniphaga sp.]
ALEWDFTLHSFCPRTEKYIWKTKIFELSNDTMIFDTREESNFFESEITVYNNSDEEIGLTGFSSHTPFFKIDAEWPVAIAAHDSIILDILFEPQDLEIGYVSDLITIASDTENQRIAQQVVVFGIKDDDANPIVEFGPDSTNVPLDPLIYFNFNEPVFGAAMLELNNENIDGFIEIRKNNSDGEKVHFDAVIDTENKKIKIRPGYILEGSTTYSVILKDGLYDYSGNVKESLSFDFVTTASTNTDNPKKDEKISIFPNPSSGSINIMNGSFQDRNIQVTVYSLLGTLIFERKNINLPAFDVEIRSVKSGIYILKINSNNGDEIYSEKLLIKKN